MGITEILLTSLAVSLDALAVSICKSLSLKKSSLKTYLIIALYLGVFQGLMPLIGYFLGATFKDFVTNVDHWVALFLLCLIGLNMIKESFSKKVQKMNDKINFKAMAPLALAISIDALAVGITFAFLESNILFAVITIGTTTFIMSIIGSKIGSVFGKRYEKKAQLIGGIILILLGLKIFLEHLNVI